MKKAYWQDVELKPGTVELVRAAMKIKLWRGTTAERMAKFRALNAAMSKHYGVPEMPVVLNAGLHSPMYFPGSKIVLTKPSLVSWAHEFGHYLLHHWGKRQNEQFPRAFSLGLFAKAAPKMFEAARAQGRLMYTEDGHGQA